MKSSIVFRLFFALILAVVAIAVLTSTLDDFPRARSLHTKTTGAPEATSTPYSSVDDFETGIVYPRWESDGYGPADASWQQAVRTIHTQTDAAWIEMPLIFSQPQNADSAFDRVTPSLETFTAGLAAAHARGYHVFIIPLMTTRVAGGWADLITFDSTPAEQVWFASYEQLYLPYIEAAQNEHAEQLSLGTEAGWLQENGSVDLWEHLITLARSHFSGKLTYDSNWGNVSDAIPSWFARLDYIGVSAYFPVIYSGYRVDPSAMPALWAQQVGTALDAYAARVGKPLVLSEIGYRNSADTFFEPWRSNNITSTDQSEQAGAVNAAMAIVSKDLAIHGTFWWGWDDVGAFALKNTKAARVLATWYEQLL